MKTGIIRRIDELGRIVIPKEIRKAAQAYENEPFEIVPGTNGIISLIPYKPGVALLTDIAKDLLDLCPVSMALCAGCDIVASSCRTVAPHSTCTDSVRPYLLSETGDELPSGIALTELSPEIRKLYPLYHDEEGRIGSLVLFDDNVADDAAKIADYVAAYIAIKLSKT